MIRNLMPAAVRFIGLVVAAVLGALALTVSARLLMVGLPDLLAAVSPLLRLAGGWRTTLAAAGVGVVLVVAVVYSLWQGLFASEERSRIEWAALRIQLLSGRQYRRSVGHASPSAALVTPLAGFSAYWKAPVLLFVGLMVIVVALTLIVLVLIGAGQVLVRWGPRPTLLRTTFWVSLFATFAVLQYPLRRRYLTSYSWKRLADPWLKWQGVSALSVGGLRLLPDVVVPDLRSVIVAARLEWLPLVYFGSVALMGMALLLSLAGRMATPSEDGREPLLVFAPAFGLAWGGALLSFTVFFTVLAALIQDVVASAS